MFKIIFLILILSACSTSKESLKPKVDLLKVPTIAFEISEGIKHPESILYSHAHKSFFVSNIASGNPVETNTVSYISKISADGKTIVAEWVKGLKAPKGLAIVGNNLYVTDVDRVVKIDIRKASISKIFPVAGSKFLNDVAVGKNGVVYISDMLSNIIYRIQHNRLSKLIQDDRVLGANGLLMDGESRLMVARWGSELDPTTFATKVPGDIVAINVEIPSEMVITQSVTGNLDGLAQDNQENLWISDWMNGDVFMMTKSGEAKKVYNFGKGTADISYAKELNLLLVPQMNQSKLMFIALEI